MLCAEWLDVLASAANEHTEEGRAEGEFPLLLHHWDRWESRRRGRRVQLVIISWTGRGDTGMGGMKEIFIRGCAETIESADSALSAVSTMRKQISDLDTSSINYPQRLP